MGGSTSVIAVPATFDERAFDELARSLNAVSDYRQLILDASGVQWCDPAGLVTLLIAGRWILARRLPRPQLLLPEAEHTRAYWVRLEFPRCASEYFEIRGILPDSRPAPSDALIPLMKLTSPSHRQADDRVSESFSNAVSRLLLDWLGMGSGTASEFRVSLGDMAAMLTSERGDTTWFSAQTYSWRRTLGRRIVLCVLGSHGSRPRSAGHLQVPPGLRQLVLRVGGTLRRRSGTTRLVLDPLREPDAPTIVDLPNYPGTLLTVVIPEPQGDADR